jgi:hypothetical protein
MMIMVYCCHLVCHSKSIVIPVINR